MYRTAVVDRVKTQTRRVITPQPREGWGLRAGPCYSYAPAIEGKDGMLDAGPEVYGIATEEEGWTATYGPPGTILPVVTTWAVRLDFDKLKPSNLDHYMVTAKHGPERKEIWWNDGTPKPDWAGKSRPAMFFPKHLYPLARQAKVVSVRAERVHSISKADVLAEGVTPQQIEMWKPWLHPDDCAPLAYGVLWDSINAERGNGDLKGQYAWKRNPWVFATTFEVLPAE